MNFFFVREIISFDEIQFLPIVDRRAMLKDFSHARRCDLRSI